MGPGGDCLAMGGGWKPDRYIDDLTGLPLVPELCRAARAKELAYFKSKGV